MNEDDRPNFGLRAFAGSVLLLPVAFIEFFALMGPGLSSTFAVLIGDKPLPTATTLVLRSYPGIFFVPLVIWGAAVLCLVVSRRRQAPYFVAAGGMVLLSTLSLFIALALILPLVTIFTYVGNA